MFSVLLVEDDASNTALLMGKFSGDRRFTVKHSPEPHQALALAGKEKFSIALVDLKLGKNDLDPVYEGIQLGEDILRESPETVIVFYSDDIKAGKEADFQYHKACELAGGDHIISRQALLTQTKRVFLPQLLTWIAEKAERFQVTQPVTFSSDWRTRALLEVVGEANLSRAVREFLPEMKEYNISALQAGFSGAAVALVESKASSESNRYETRSILKVARSTSALDDELERQPLPGSLLAWHSPSFTQPRVLELGGEWKAVLVAAVRDAKPLEDALLRALDGRVSLVTIVKYVRRVATELLVGPAGEAFRLTESDGAQLYRLRAPAGVEILDFLGEAQRWAWIPASQLKELKRVAECVERILKGAWDFGVHAYPVARLHGDFHCRNVFVSAGRATVIDFGRSDVYPRLFDFAGLDADLLFGIMDRHRGHDHMREKSGVWLRLAKSLFPFVEREPSDQFGSDVVQQCRRVLHFSLRGVQDVSSREYATVLLFQSLRYLRFSTLSVPKRLFAARLAAAILARWQLS